jgi:hypothetical protein
MSNNHYSVYRRGNPNPVGIFKYSELPVLNLLSNITKGKYEISKYLSLK